MKRVKIKHSLPCHYLVTKSELISDGGERKYSQVNVSAKDFTEAQFLADVMRGRIDARVLPY